MFDSFSVCGDNVGSLHKTLKVKRGMDADLEEEDLLFWAWAVRKKSPSDLPIID